MRGGERLGTNGNWCGTMPFPAGRDGARPLRGGERRRSRRGVVTPPYGCNAGGAKRRADVGIGPYEKKRKLHRPPGPAAQSERLRRGWEEGAGIAAEIIPKGASNLGQSLSQPAADSSLYTREPWGRGMRIAASALQASSQ